MSFRQIKEDARKQVHEEFAYDATYTSPLGVITGGLRVRRSFFPLPQSIGDLGGLSGVGSAGFAGTQERQFTATFLVADLIPERGGRIMFEDGYEFIVKLVHQPYGLTVTAEVEIVE